MKTKTLNIILIMVTVLNLSALAFIQPAVTVTTNRVEVDYPDTATFMLEFESDVEIVEVQLSYGTDALSCVDATSRVFPEDFKAGKNVSTEWEWDFKRTGPIPPGTEVWWQWTLTDANGKETVTKQQSFLFWDEDITWKTKETDNMVIYWIDGSEGFADIMLDAGEDLVGQLNTELDIELSEKVGILVYPNGEMMKDATHFLPAWSGGVAFTEYHKVMMAVAPGDTNWGTTVMRHEMVHVIVGQYIFSCVTNIPSWLSEGIAMYYEGEWRSSYVSILARAIEEDAIFSVIELGHGFSGDGDLASLSYAQSHSITEYLMETYGEDKMLLLLDQFRLGINEDRALNTVYGFDRNGLEAEWRIWAGAVPIEVGPAATATPTRTPVPTIAPIGGPASSSASATPEEVLPSPTAHAVADAQSESDNNTAVENGGAGVFPPICGGFVWLIVMAVMVGVRNKKKFNQNEE